MPSASLISADLEYFVEARHVFLRSRFELQTGHADSSRRPLYAYRVHRSLLTALPPLLSAVQPGPSPSQILQTLTTRLTRPLTMSLLRTRGLSSGPRTVRVAATPSMLQVVAFIQRHPIESSCCAASSHAAHIQFPVGRALAYSRKVNACPRVWIFEVPCKTHSHRSTSAASIEIHPSLPQSPWSLTPRRTPHRCTPPDQRRVRPTIPYPFPEGRRDDLRHGCSGCVVGRRADEAGPSSHRNLGVCPTCGGGLYASGHKDRGMRAWFVPITENACVLGGRAAGACGSAR